MPPSGQEDKRSPAKRSTGFLAGVVKGLVSSASVGGSLTVPTVTVTDDNTTDSETEYYIYVKNPDTLLTRVQEGDVVKFDMVGSYALIVYAVDGSGNIAYEIKEIKVS